ncbi:MGMT family protein [Microlunatus flavus]|uniref:Alkylated DNA nucleotide flippase Atl1, participates in nucleotide excision repair, Ada-like DNA-binding domain n=1 Tax=Microlunatus flavus TaxID=1036181 RepID=A0A1H9I3X3_9ACTN|nr:MGMT family protein [Microlunatus flavus]SEQ69192.1 Alkylated DNA nucleotide flippase Atl1, participates in nucleotide excision repair, Ada-like DNA-binding domain [Microlunatus flavus]
MEHDPRLSGARTEDFVEQVLRLVEAVPVGSVTTYGDLAAMVGRGGPRQVGTVLARHGSGVPWWRVVRADGRPAEGLAPRALRHLLEDGVAVVDGRVRMASARWRPAPDELAEHQLPGLDG